MLTVSLSDLLSRRDLSARLAELNPNIVVYGHERRGWVPQAQLLDPPRPTRTVFRVLSGDGGKCFVETGPEARPFPELMAIDVEALAMKILE